jgi:alpha-tubulin suppressor-like RCC1 family protein
MPTFYNYTENGVVYSFDDVFVPAEPFRQGTLFTWGSATNPTRLGAFTSFSDRITPIQTSAGGTNWKQVDGVIANLGAIKTDGTLWTWGGNSNGELGDNTRTDRIGPVTTFAGGNNWKQIACGYNHTAAIKTDGTLWTWGSNSNGQLGDNTTNIRCTPVTTFAGGTNWKQVACAGEFGLAFSAAIKTDGTLWTWGNNLRGQLGDNTGTNKITPVTTFAGGTNWKQVSCGGSAYIAAIKTDGTLWVWGISNLGQLGAGPSGSGSRSSTPITTFAGGNNWKQVSAGHRHAAAIKTDGTLWIWGTNSYGALGDNTTSTRNTPVTTFAGGTNWKQVACGATRLSASGPHTAAIKTDGTLWTWGRNSYGQLGDNTTTDRFTPVTTFAGGTNWKQVACAGANTSATTYIDDYV